MKTEYRLVEYRKDGGAPYWVIEEKIKLWVGLGEWREVDDGDFYTDYNVAVNKLSEYRKRTIKVKVFRKVLDV